MQSFQRFIQLSALLLTVGSVSEPFFIRILTVAPVQAQSAPHATFPLPASLPKDAIVKVDGSSSMEVINESLKQRFLEKFPGTTVDMVANGSDEAVKALLDGKVNVAALGRPLTAQEKDQGLVLAPVSREKIAIIVGSDNPFKGNITFDQFAKMFRGEITNWSEVGGKPGKIRFIDRPETSDTRRALSTYKVFQAAPFENGVTTTRLKDDDTDAVVKELGTDGIGYAIADQVSDRSGVRIMVMHGTLPDDPRYPYSQPRGYVYKQGIADPATLAFLGFATSKPGQEIVQEAKSAEAIAASPTATVSPVPATSPAAESALVPSTGTTATSEVSQRFPWWLLGIPLVGGLLWWFLKGRRGTSAPVASPVHPTAVKMPAAAPVPVVRTDDCRIILTPRNCRDGYAYWEVSDEALAEARRQGGQALKLRLYEVTGIQDMDRQTPHSMKEFDCNPGDRDQHIPIPVDNRDYVVELGYLTADHRWLKVARSELVRVPACPPVQDTNALKVGGAILAGGAAVAAGVATHAVGPFTQIGAASRIILTARNSKDAYAYWEVPDTEKQAAKQEGGKKMMLRLYDVTDINMDEQYPHTVQQFDINEVDQDKHLPIPVSNRDYITEVGYVTEEGCWIKLARSNHIRIPADVPLGGTDIAAGGVTSSVAMASNLPHIITGAPALAPTSVTSEKCTIQHLKVHSRNNCYLLNADQMQQLENNVSVTHSLEPGHYIIRIRQGVFSYCSETETRGEPLVLLWIHGGKFINQKTNIPVNATWSTLNGYDEALCLKVLEPATLHAFFFDTYIDDNDAETIVSVIRCSSL
ncbi:ABC-type phosphate transport system, periplasmic component [Leptolyngbyaceae cyanobacterium JSC-12]|nr:ABC-type phosphate transport system, periplasmic component [Leptolyngbyaceae cyanobacterium JSC-12]